MRGRAGLGLVLAARCWQRAAAAGRKCPKPVVYDEATLRKIQKALAALPRDSILHAGAWTTTKPSATICASANEHARACITVGVSGLKRRAPCAMTGR